MSLVQQLQQEIQSLRDRGMHREADNLQSRLDQHNAMADSADEELRARQARKRRNMGF